MQRLTIVMVCVGALSMGVGAILLRHPPREHAPPGSGSSRASSPEVVALQAEVEALRRETRALSLRNTQNAAAVESAPPPAPKPTSAADEQLANERAYTETKYRFERTFAADEGTSDWGRTTEASLRSTLNELAPEMAGQVLSIDCRSRICRIKTEHESHRQSLDFMDSIEGRPGFAGARYVRIRSAAGTEKYEFFLEPRGPSESLQERF